MVLLRGDRQPVTPRLGEQTRAKRFDLIAMPLDFSRLFADEEESLETGAWQLHLVEWKRRVRQPGRSVRTGGC